MPDQRSTSWATLAVLLLTLAGCGTAPAAQPAGPVTVSTVDPTTATATATSPAPSPSATLSPTAVPSSSRPAASTTRPSPAPTASTPVPSGPVLAGYGDSLRLSGSTLTFTVLRWYTGKSIKARCKAKHIKSETEWCNDYYYETTSQRRTVTVGSQTAIRLLTEQPKLIPATPDKLAAAIKEDVWPNFRIWTKGGQATRIDQVFTP